MTTLRIRRTVAQDHQLHLVLPRDFPTGEVDVTVRSAQPPAGEDERVAQGRRDLQQLFALIDRTAPRPGRSIEEIDRYVAEERASWD